MKRGHQHAAIVDLARIEVLLAALGSFAEEAAPLVFSGLGGGEGERGGIWVERAGTSGMPSIWPASWPLA